MSLWPPGVVQRLTSQTPPQHVVQHPRAPVVGWQHQYQQQGFQHTAQQQQQQLCLLLEQQQQLHYQQLQPDQHWEALQYVLQQQGPVQQQAYTSPTRGCVVVAAAAVAKQQTAAEAAATFIACLPPAAFDNIQEIVALQHELVQWPQDKQPKQGYISKAKLRKLTMSELRAELSRLQVSDTKGLKEDLINILLAHLLDRSIAAAAAAASAAGNGDAAAAPMHVSLASRGELMLHRASTVLYRAVQQQQTVPGQRVGLQVLTACQVSDLQAALQAVWPLVQPISTISRDQLLAGSPADLVYKLLLCLAACADMNSSSFEAVQVAAQSAQPAQAVSRGTAVQQADVQPQQAVQSTKVDLRQQIQDALSQVPQMPPPRQQQQQQQSPVPKQSQPPAQQAQGSTSSSTRNTLQQQLQQQRQAPEDVPAGYTQPQGPVVVPGTMPPYDAQEAARVAAAVGVNLDDLPPLAQQARGHVYDVDWMTGFTEQEKDYVLKANRSGLTLTLVGGAVDGGLTGDSSARCISLLRERDAWLFDAGEDTQRLLMWLEHLRPSKLHRIVVSRQSPDALLGLPGILCVIGSAREKGHEKADIPVHVFAPEGTCEFLNTMYDCGNTFLEMPVVVHEFVHHAVSQDEMAPQLFNNRSKLWRVLVPPDQLNPDGFVDARLENFSPLQGRARTMSGSRSAGGVLAKNPRAGYRPLPTPPPGDPTLRDLARSDMTWTIQADEAAMLTAVAVEAEDLTWAMVWKEADKQGNLSVPRCLALGITNGGLYGVAKTGEAVPNDDGITIPAYMVCTQDKPGRKLVVLPACESAAAVGRYAADADVMFADAGAARDAAPSAPLGAAVGVCAREWGVRTLVTTAMPQSDDVRRAENLENNWFNPGWRKRRLGHVGNSYMSSRESDSEDESDQQQQQQQRASEQQSPEQSEGKLSDQQGEQERELPIPGSWQEAAQTDPTLGSFLQAVAQKYDSGLLIPGRDCMSLIVEENSGKALPAVLDMNAKEAEARATSLVMCIDALDPSNKQQQGGAQQWQQGGGGYKGRGGGGQQQRRSGQRSGQYQQRQGGQQRQQQWQQRGERSMAR